ncbi:unnamed protein product [Trichobilharzia regenti]|nr:unnamed protein product [Trichobilharzia regenti]
MYTYNYESTDIPSVVRTRVIQSYHEETWFNSNVLHNRVSIPRFGSPSRTLDNYEVCDTRLKQYLSELNELTEYQDKYLAHTPSVKKPVRYY